VVNQGTGQRVKQIKDIKIYAKTSTAQTSSLEKHDMGREFLEHGWFVGYFWYKDQKPLTIVILVEHAATSRVPTGIAASFLREYKKMIDVSG
jgi:cell division protein FtsI/penicillin-binding protein 2